MAKKKVLIDIDFVLRDWITALQNIYIKQIEEWEGEIESVENIWEAFKFPQYIELQREVDIDGECQETTLAIDEKAEWEPNREYFTKFMLDNVLEIFGHAKEVVPNAVAHINKLQVENPDWEIILFSKSKSKAIPATYFFLSKCGCEIKNVKFINDGDDLLQIEKLKIIITANDYTEYIKNNSEIEYYFVKSQFNENSEKHKEYISINSIKEIISFT